MAFVLVESRGAFLTWPGNAVTNRSFTISTTAMRATKLATGTRVDVYLDVEASLVQIAAGGPHSSCRLLGYNNNGIVAFVATGLRSHGQRARSVRCPLVEATDDSLTFDVSKALKPEDEYV